MGLASQMERINELEELCRKNGLGPPPRPPSLASAFERDLDRVRSEVSEAGFPSFESLLDAFLSHSDLTECRTDNYDTCKFTKQWFHDTPEEFREFMASTATFTSKGELIDWDLSGIRLPTLPSLAGLKVSGTLNLSSCGIETLPDDIGESSIGHLWLQNNRIAALPTSISRLKACEHIDLRHNQLTDFPEGFGSLDLKGGALAESQVVHCGGNLFEEAVTEGWRNRETSFYFEFDPTDLNDLSRYMGHGSGDLEEEERSEECCESDVDDVWGDDDDDDY